MGSATEHAIVVTAREQAELLPVEADRRPLGPDEVSGRTLATLVSVGTEMAACYQGSRFPSTPGYAAVLQVDAVGAAVADLKPGDRAFCMGPHRSFQRASRQDVVPVPDDVPAETGVFARLMGVTMSTLATTTARPPETVVVTGLGIVGNLGAQIFSRCGYRVIACDPSAHRRELAERAGLESVLPAVPLDDPEVAGKVGLVLECSGHEAAVLDGCKVIRKRGEVVLVGVPWQRRTDLTAHALLDAVFHRYAVVRSGWEWEVPRQPTEFQGASMAGNYAAALRWLAEGSIRVDGLAAIVSPREAQRVYRELLHGQWPALTAIFNWGSLKGRATAPGEGLSWAACQQL